MHSVTNTPARRGAPCRTLIQLGLVGTVPTAGWELPPGLQSLELGINNISGAPGTERAAATEKAARPGSRLPPPQASLLSPCLAAAPNHHCTARPGPQGPSLLAGSCRTNWKRYTGRATCCRGACQPTWPSPPQPRCGAAWMQHGVRAGRLRVAHIVHRGSACASDRRQPRHHSQPPRCLLAHSPGVECAVPEEPAHRAAATTVQDNCECQPCEQSSKPEPLFCRFGALGLAPPWRSQFPHAPPLFPCSSPAASRPRTKPSPRCKS